MACTRRSAACATCAMRADYATVQGERILPFIIALDEAGSNLAPAPGELQRFCYTITGVGEDTSAYVDLSHMMLGVCPDIPLSALSDVTVVIDGVEQEIEMGENVDILPPDQPDPPTGCPGLKLDFEVDKEDGVMRLCFSLATTYAVGPVPICLYGGGIVAEGLSICGPVCENAGGCMTMSYQNTTMSVPVVITPTVRMGETTTTCCGEATVTPGTTPGVCGFTLTRRLCVAVPIYFGAEAAIGSASLECGGISSTFCADCGEEPGE